MATYSNQLRRGLPRAPGGEPWPPAGTANIDVSPAVAADRSEPDVDVTASESPAPPIAPSPVTPQAESPAVPPQEGSAPRALRRGLPRVPGGEPWPAAGTAPFVAASAGGRGDVASGAKASDETLPSESPRSESSRSEVRGSEDPGSEVRGSEVPGSEARRLRRGLPRVPGGEPWPAAGTAPTGAPAVSARTDVSAGVNHPAQASPAEASSTEAEPHPASAESASPASSESPAAASSASASPSIPAAPTVADAETAAAATPQTAKPDPERASVGATKTAPQPDAKPAGSVASAAPATKPASAAPASAAPASVSPASVSSGSETPRRVRRIALWAVGLVAAAGIIVLAARGVTTLPGVPAFLERYPGQYDLPAFVDDGFPGWARWTHYLNFFFMVLIVQSGWRVRQQQKPPAFYTPRRGGKKVSIHLWLHTSLDVLWMVNGLAFVVLIFVTGHWARIVPTSFEVFPNALSALLQYLTLEWPHEDGWVNYNSLQQLMYFTVVFIAAPLAAITGFRMSEWWPKDAAQLNRAYPAPLARAIHFPVMLFFVLFVIVHVFLVFATGALKNLNHMYVGTPDPSWAGFWWFAAGLAVAVGAAFATRPLLLAPIAGATGNVSNR